MSYCSVSKSTVRRTCKQQTRTETYLCIACIDHYVRTTLNIHELITTDYNKQSDIITKTCIITSHSPQICCRSLSITVRLLYRICQYLKPNTESRLLWQMMECKSIRGLD